MAKKKSAAAETETRLIQVEESELSKVKNSVLNQDQLKILYSKTPERFVYTRKGKGGTPFKYIPTAYVQKVLNLLFGWDWDHTVVMDLTNLDTTKQVIVMGRLTVRVLQEDGRVRTIVKDQVGRKDVMYYKDKSKGIMDYGNDYKAAVSDSLKKCASQLGIASDIYGPKEFTEIQVIEDQPDKEEVLKSLKKDLLDRLEVYEGEDKEEIREMVKGKIEAGEFTISFAENTKAKLDE